MIESLFKKKLFFKKSQGFTMVEILIVVLIIIILFVALYFSIGQMQKKARDEKRKADLRAIVHALELKYNENLRYPEAIPQNPTAIYSFANSGILEPYLNPIPSGVLNQYEYQWYRDETAQNFCIFFQLELNNQFFSCTRNGCHSSTSLCGSF